MNDTTTSNMFDAVDNPPVNPVDPVPVPEVKVEVKEPVSGPTPPPSPEDVPYFIDTKADLVVGATGSGKTINIGIVADYVLLKYGKLARVCSTDPSGSGPLKGKVKAGKIEFWPVHAWKNKIDAMYKSTLGYWPLRVDDPESPIVPPDAGTWEVYGFGAFEGLTSYGDTVLDDLRDKKASLSQDPSYTWRQGDFETSGANQAYYGMMQDTLKLWVVNTHLLRYERVLWTALESRGKDRDGNVVKGPLIGGKQATGKAGQWFLNFVHMDIIPGEVKVDPVTKQELIETKHVLFLKTHIDPLDRIPFPTKIRAPLKYIKDVPDYIPDGNMATMYILLDEMYARETAEGIKELDSIKGLKERLLERAGKAKLAEAAAAEKRAKAGGLLKSMVSVPAHPPVSRPLVPAQVATPSVVGSLPVAPAPAATPRVPAGLPTIQNVRASSSTK